MSHINTLIPDIYRLVQSKGWFTDDIKKELERAVSSRIKPVFEEKERRGLRLSQLGPKCPRALWYSIHHPELAEPLPPWAEMKYLYGHLIEALAITLAKASGHQVEGEQDALFVDGVKGHRDCVIDGCLCDVKSTNSRSFSLFRDHTLAQNDNFGYLDQLDAYLVGSADDPIVKEKEKAYDWAIDKTLGHMCLYEHRLRENSIRERIKHYREIIERDTPPSCTCGTVPDGESGNIKLDTRASYSAYKYCCFPHLRTFLYEDGPRYLSKVVRVPMRRDRKTPIPEVDRNGKRIFH